MANDTVITVVGNLTADPELRTVASGAQVVNFTIASTSRTFDRTTQQWKDGEPLYLRCNAWQRLAEHIAQSLSKGTRVIAQGRLHPRSYITQQGEKKDSIELVVDEIGPSLTFATAQVERASRATGFNAPSSSAPVRSAAPMAAPTSEPWAAYGDFGASDGAAALGVPEDPGF